MTKFEKDLPSRFGEKSKRKARNLTRVLMEMAAETTKIFTFLFQSHVLDFKFAEYSTNMKFNTFCKYLLNLEKIYHPVFENFAK